MAYLAQYTIRSKQKYIFRTNKMLDITGASVHISCAWKYMRECMDKLGLKIQTVKQDFSMEKATVAFDAGNVQMIELFEGGGNYTVLFNKKDTFVRANKAFSYYLLTNCPGMIPMAVGVESTGDYRQDYANLMKVAEIEKNRMDVGQDSFILPFTMMDRDTFKPVTRIDFREGKAERYSEERYSKRTKGLEVRNNDKCIKLLDDMVTKKGEESLLAIVHADGNNMGNKIINMLGEEKTYDVCVARMREFTDKTKVVFGRNGLAALNSKHKELTEQKGIAVNEAAFRVIINDGDDMTFICNARHVMEYVEAYLKSVEENTDGDKYSSCAGLCIFHSHYPFAKAYELAEQACDNAKKNVHKQVIAEESWCDFHFIHSGIGGDLEAIRDKHNTVGCIARPWGISEGVDTVYTLKNISNMALILDESKNKIPRAAIKAVGAAAEESTEVGLRELQRMFNRYQDIKNQLVKLFGNEENLLKAMYDYSEVYDLWYAGR